jgi:hypothetical protein
MRIDIDKIRKEYEDLKEKVNYRESVKNLCCDCKYLQDVGLEDYFECTEVFGANLDLSDEDYYTCDKFKTINANDKA